MKVEGIVHPTTGEIDLKEEVGKSKIILKQIQILETSEP